MKVFDMLKAAKGSKEEPKKEVKEPAKGHKYDKSYLERTLAKYLINDEVLEAVLPAFEKLNKEDPEGKFIDSVMDVLEFKEQEIQSFYDNQDKFQEESDPQDKKEISFGDDKKEQEQVSEVEKILAERYGETL